MTFPNRLITVKETAELLSISDRKVRDLIARPKASPDHLPSHHIGGKIVLDPEEIKE